MTKISVIIPVYMVEKYICECIDSVINQSYKNIEIVIIDDGSKDNSPQLCDMYQRKDSRIKVIHKPNGGLSSARNAGLNIASGEYVVFLDSDDCLRKNAIEEICTKLSTSPDVLITEIYNTYNMSEDDLPEQLFITPKGFNKQNVFEYLFSKDDLVWPAPQYIVKRDLIEQYNLRFPEGYYHEDVYWTARLFAFANSFDYYNKVWYIRRFEREGSITTEINPKRTKDQIQLVQALLKEDCIINLPKPEKECMIASLSETAMWTLLFCRYYNVEDIDEISRLLECDNEFVKYTRKTTQKLFSVLLRCVGARHAIKLLRLVLMRKQNDQ